MRLTEASRKRLLTTGRSAASTTAFAVVLLAAGSTMSWAAESRAASRDAVSEGGGGRVTFYSYGDKIEVCDTATDAQGPYGVYKYYKSEASPIQGRHNQTRGNGACNTWDHDFAEGKTILIRKCQDLPVLPDTCLPWKTGIV